jgi:ubiquitin-activating enzyme E1
VNNIEQMLYNFPKDAVTSSGAPFWSGPKRAPTVNAFDMNDSLHMSFIVTAANLYAFNFGLKGISR